MDSGVYKPWFIHLAEVLELIRSKQHSSSLHDTPALRSTDEPQPWGQTSWVFGRGRLYQCASRARRGAGELPRRTVPEVRLRPRESHSNRGGTCGKRQDLHAVGTHGDCSPHGLVPAGALLGNSDQPLTDHRVPKSRVETTPTAVRMNRGSLSRHRNRAGSSIAGLGTTAPPHLSSVDVAVTEATGCAVAPDQELGR